MEEVDCEAHKSGEDWGAVDSETNASEPGAVVGEGSELDVEVEEVETPVGAAATTTSSEERNALVQGDSDEEDDETDGFPESEHEDGRASSGSVDAIAKSQVLEQAVSAPMYSEGDEASVGSCSVDGELHNGASSDGEEDNEEEEDSGEGEGGEEDFAGGDGAGHVPNAKLELLTRRSCPEQDAQEDVPPTDSASGARRLRERCESDDCDGGFYECGAPRMWPILAIVVFVCFFAARAVGGSSQADPKLHQALHEAAAARASVSSLEQRLAAKVADVADLANKLQETKTALKNLRDKAALVAEDHRLSMHYLTEALDLCGWWCEETKQSMSTYHGWRFVQDPNYPRIVKGAASPP